jgi:hypothetical protein
VDELSLEALAERYHSDKGEHGYGVFYEDLLAKRRLEPLKVLELGVGGFDRPDDPAWGGGSLRMWKHYLPHASIWGLDTLDKSGVAEDRITIVRGSQVDADLLHQLSSGVGPFDLIVDDASHIPALTVRSFEILFPMLAPGGVYIIEDLCTSYWPLWGGRLRRRATGTTMDLVKQRLDGLNHAEFKVANYRPTDLDRSTVEIRARHNIVAFVKGQNIRPSGMNHPNPIGLGGWLQQDVLPAAVSALRRPKLLSLLEQGGLRPLAGRIRRRLVPTVER